MLLFLLQKRHGKGVKQILSCDSAKTFADIPLTRLYKYIQNVFNIQLDVIFRLYWPI